MTAHIRVSSKGQVVLPKDVRDALKLAPGEILAVSLEGSRIVLEPMRRKRETISYEEFRRRVPRHEGPPVPVEEMTSKIGDLFRDWKV